MTLFEWMDIDATDYLTGLSQITLPIDKITKL